MDFWNRLDQVANRWNVLRHPFYVRWSEGTLTRAELALYAAQYAHTVEALAAGTRRAAALDPSPTAEEHAAEEEAHVALWGEFATAVGAAPAEPLAETSDCTRAWADPERALLPTLVALYAVESAQPAISETKRTGLVERYGFTPGAATAYFDLHAVRDLEHARAGREAIAALLDDSEDHGALVAEAERALSANWRLLDGVDRACAAASAGTS
jgi:pyrroloquinoline-quinone synthase